MMPLLQGDDFSYQFYRLCLPQNPNSPCKVTVKKSVHQTEDFFFSSTNFFFYEGTIELLEDHFLGWKT
jgi:hypothetical protein